MKPILFIRLRLLGDIVFTIPALEVYKKNFPDHKIFYVVEEKFKEIAALIPAIDHLIVIPRKMSLGRMWGFRKKIKQLEIDTVIDFHSGPKSAQLTFLTRAKTRIGYRTPNRNWAYNHLVSREFGDSPTHSVFNQAKLLEPLGISIDEEQLPPYPVIPIDEKVTPISEEVKTAVNRGKEEGIKKAVLHVGAGNPFRDWGMDKFSGLIERLKDDNITVFLVGHGQEEQDKAGSLAERYQIPNFSGKLSIAELLYLISHSHVYVGADSGPLHVASLTATPLVALYGPNIPEISGPWREKDVTIIRRHMECQPCGQRTCIYGIIPCMKNIKTDEIYEAIIRYTQ